MIAVHHDRANFWLRLKLLLTLGGKTHDVAPPKQAAKPKHRSHRCTTFLEMP